MSGCNVYGGYCGSSSEVNTDLFADGNTVNIIGGKVSACNVYGGYCGSSWSGDFSASINIVNITGGLIAGDIYGGYCVEMGDATGNKVIISGGDLSNASVYGYNRDVSSHSNNTLQIENSVAIKKIANFDKVNFVLPTITGNKTLLTLTDVFSMAGLPVSIYVGDNLNSTLNTYDVTLVNNVSGEFDVAYYDKDKNETGYVEKFNLASAGALVIGKGTEMHLTKNLTTGAGELLGKQNTLYVDNGATITFNAGTLTKKVQGAGNLKFVTDMSVDANNIANTGTNTVESDKTVTFTDGEITQNWGGAGNLDFATDMIVNADNIANTGTNTVESGKTLTFTGGTLTKKIQGAGNLSFDTDMSVDFAKLANTGFLVVNAGKTLTSTSESNLTKNIAGTGTIKLGGTMNVLGNQSIEGTLDGNGKILNMTNNATGSPINYLMVGTLKGNTDLQLDVDLNRLTSDMILANAVDSGANINVKSINITADNPAGMPTASNIIFITESGDTPTHGTYSVNGATGLITMTNTHTYKFEIGGSGILQCSEIGGEPVTFKDFIEGTNTSTADTFSLTDNYNYTDTGTANMAATTQIHDTLNINLNGYNLNKTSSVMTVNTGAKTLNVNGGSTEGSTDLNFNVATGGKLNVSGKTDLKGNVTNAGDVKFTDETKVEGTLSGAGSYANSGTMTVADTSKLQMTNGLENTGTLNLGNSTNSVLGTNITGNGTTVIAGNVSNANGKTISQNALNITGTLTTDLEKLNVTNNINNNGIFIVNSGTLAKNIAGTGTVKLNGTMNVFENKSIEGTLDGNGKILNMTNNAVGSPINSLMVGTLKGNTDLQLDVDLNRLASDMILANAVDSGANINVKSINITADNPTGLSSSANLTFLTEIGTTPTHGTYTVNSPTGSITMTNSHTYKFELGGNGILKCSEVGASASFKEFIEGNGTTADTFSLTENYNYTDTGTAYMGAETQTHNTLNINLNGHNLNKTSSVMTVNTGAKTLNVNGGNTQGSTDLNFNVETGGKLNISGKTNIQGNIAGDGTTEFNGEIVIADGVHLGTATNNVSGTLDVAGNITASNINFKSGSTLKVDGTKIQYVAAISNLTSASVESGSKLYVANAEKDREYKILKGSNLDVRSWTTEETVTGINASYGLIVDTVTNDGSVFNITFKEDVSATGSSDIKNILANLPADGELKTWVDNISAGQEDAAIQGNTVNTMANMAQLANVQHGTYEINNFTMENAFDYMGVENRNMQTREDKAKLQNTSADTENKNDIVTLPLEKMDEEQPREEEQEKTYSKEVWATIIHSKEKIDGMKTGHLEQDSTLQYNGTTVGADLWSDKHGFGGVAVTYADGNFAGTQKISDVKNDADFYGINVYNGHDIKKVSIQYDIGYTHTDNDVKMHTLGAEEVTAKPKVDAYSAGVKLEQPIKIGKMAKFIPFIGARYMFLKSKNYTNNLGLGYDTDDQHLFKIPIGVTLKEEYQIGKEFLFSTLISAGYTWNLGDRDGKQNVSYGGYSDIIDYSIADKGEYFVRAAIQAAYEKLLFELGYRYTKGKTVRDNKWYLNMNVEY